MTLDITKPPFQTERGQRVYFVGYTSDGRTVWEHADAGTVSIRNADGRRFAEHPSGDDVINAPPTKGKETLWANIYPPDGRAPRGFLYSTLELAKANAAASVIDNVPVEVEYTMLIRLTHTSAEAY